MSRTLTAADRSALIRLASTMEKGSDERMTILAGLSKSAPDARALLQDLEVLAELDENLTDIVDTFAFNLKMAGLDPTVQSQFDTLDKAEEGLQKVKEVMRSAQKLVVMFPEDKTAARVLKDADVMLRRFQRHEKSARTMIKKLSKKAMPPDLVKAATSLETAVKRMLVKPKALDVIPWQREAKNFTTRVTGVEYQMVFILPTPERGEYQKEQRLYLIQSTLDRDGVKYGLDFYNLHRAKPYSLKEAKAGFLAGLEGWSGIKGSEDVVSQRAKIVPDIKDALRSVARRLNGGFSRDVEVSKDNRELNVTFRTGVDSRDYGQYDESYTEYALDHYAPEFVAALKPYSKYIKDQRISSEGYKGYWTYYLTLK